MPLGELSTKYINTYGCCFNCAQYDTCKNPSRSYNKACAGWVERCQDRLSRAEKYIAKLEERDSKDSFDAEAMRCLRADLRSTLPELVDMEKREPFAHALHRFIGQTRCKKDDALASLAELVVLWERDHVTPAMGGGQAACDTPEALEAIRKAHMVLGAYKSCWREELRKARKVLQMEENDD